MVEIFIIIFLIFLEGFFSSAEIAFLSAKKVKVISGDKKGERWCRLIMEEWKKPQKLLTTTLTGATLCVVIASTIAAHIINRNLGSGYEFITGAILLPFIVLFGEIIPKDIGYSYSMKVLKFSIYPLRFLFYIFSPVYFIFSIVEKLMPEINPTISTLKVKKREISEAIEIARSHGKLFERERLMAEKIMGSGEVSLDDIKTPLVDVVAVEKNENIEKLIKILKDTGFSRIPVFSEKIFNIEGYVDIKDVFGNFRDPSEKVSRFQKRILYFPETMPANSALFRLLQNGEKIAATVDEFGGVTGIVTITDIVEYFLGGFEKVKIHAQKSGSQYVYHFLGRTPVEDVEKILNIKFPQEFDSVTIGGMLSELFERIPSTGEEIIFLGYRWRIALSDGRSIKSIEVGKL